MSTLEKQFLSGLRLLGKLGAIRNRLRRDRRVGSLRRWCVAAWNWTPLSPLGWSVGVVLWWVLLRFGLERDDQLLRAIGGAGLVVLGLVSTVTLAAAIWMRVRGEDDAPESLSLETEIACHTGYRLPLVGRIPLLNVALRWSNLPGSTASLVDEQGDLVERITYPERAAINNVVRQFTVSDVFGLARVTFSRRTACSVRVYPRPAPPAETPFWHQYCAGDGLPSLTGPPEGDRIEIREYACGDPLKHVHWKIHGRTGRVMVRVPERAVERCERVAASLVAGHGDGASASIARSFLESCVHHSEFLFCADGEGDVTRDPKEALEQVVRSANAKDRPGSGLDALMQYPEARSCLLFVPNQPGDWLQAVAARLERSEQGFRVVVGVGELATQCSGAAWRRVLIPPVQTGACAVPQVRTVCDRLRRAGADVLLVDYQTGHKLSIDTVEPIS